jgi:secondary thiamine-phosphate synthase enzyme
LKNLDFSSRPDVLHCIGGLPGVDSPADPTPPEDHANVLQQAQHRLVIDTQRPGFMDLTSDIGHWLQAIGAHDGLLTVFVRHTSASLTIQENADPDVLRDLTEALERTAPRQARYHHGIEGPDDMPAHIKSMLTSTTLGIPVADGKAMLGTWQAVYLIEHRDAPHSREIALHYVGTVRP